MDIYKLLEKREKKNSYRDELFPKILKQCHRRIEFSNNAGELKTVFTIPKYVIGYPRFDKTECIDYLLTNLTKNGFDTYTIGNNSDYLIISWEQVYNKYKEDKETENKLLEFEPAKLVTTEKLIEDKPKISKIDKSIFSKPIKKFSLLD